MKSKLYLEKKSKQYKLELFKKFVLLDQGHPGSIFSMMDLVVCLFHNKHVRFDKKTKKFIDKVIVSKGHATSALYPVLRDFGLIKKNDFENWGKKKDSKLRIFGNKSIPGIDVTSGSLGHGVGIGVGLAYSYKNDKINKKVYVIISEGELYEGSTWEALLFASHYKLDNLVIIIDINSLIILGKTEKCMKLDPIEKKISSFNLNVIKCNGHNFKSINTSLQKIKKNVSNCILAQTVKGKGFSIMENKPNWHYWNKLSSIEIQKCLKEIS
tara:strand:- start:2037 stop:2843 length:807 start_codon:yes stop_codon:yes gene_type:complete